MKNLITTVGITMLILFTQNLIAQSEFFEETEIDLTELNDEQKDKYNKLKENRSFKKVSRIKINNLNKLQKEGKLKFKIPNQQHKVTAYPTYVDAVDLQTFEWVGELIDKDGLEVGTLTLLAKNGAVYGSMQAYGEQYLLRDMGENKKNKRVTLLIQQDAEVLGSSTCPGGALEDGLVEKIQSMPRSSCTTADIRVLVLFTNNAYNAGFPSQSASTGIANLNQTLRNSGVTASDITITLAGVQRTYELDENAAGINGEGAAALNAVKSSSKHEELRNAYRADLVIVLTQGISYYIPPGGSSIPIVGIAGINDAALQSGLKYGIVEIDASSNTFIHELGHLLGGRHENDSDSRTNRAYVSRQTYPYDCSSTFRTIMYHISSDAVYHFSNSDVTVNYNGCKTGESNRDVVSRIMSNRCAIYNFNTNNSDFQVYINGPSYISNSSQIYTWYPQVTGCNGSITSYTWAYSTNGYSWTNFSYSYSGSKSGNSFPYGYRNLFIRLTVQCSNGEIATRVKPITNYSYYNYFTQTDTESALSRVITSSSSDVEISISPNPVNNVALVKINLQERTKAVIQLINGIGQRLKEITPRFEKGYNEFPLDLSKYENGLYFVNISLGDNNIQSVPVILQK